MNVPLPFALGAHALPDLVRDAAAAFVERDDRSPEARARLVIQLSKLSTELDNGGPFGAAIFDADDKLVSVGINRVVPWGSYEFHAEGVALALAKTVAPEHFMLPERWSLVTSSAPCCMCFGRIFWSGLRGLAICARREDVESLTGFDEGPIPDEWQSLLRARSFTVTEDILRDEARAVLAAYKGPLYQRASGDGPAQ
ncbi:MAG: nucleoside deaminase [Myxococcales bacterium]|nr:nucleoside deaminase [Myxococcales bacterium]